MNPNSLNQVEKINKPREEQEKEFKEFISPYAKPGCQICLGRGWSGWHVELLQLIPCTCIQEAINQALVEQPIENHKNVIQHLRNMFKMN